MVQQLQQRKPSKHCQDNAEMIPDDVTQPVGRRRHDLHRQDDDTHEERSAWRRQPFQPSTQGVSKSTFERVEKRPAEQSPTQRAHKRRKHKVESDNCCSSKQNENISNCIVECLLQSLLVALGNVLPDVVQIFQRRWRHFGRHRKCLPFHVIWPQEFPLTQNWLKTKISPAPLLRMRKIWWVLFTNGITAQSAENDRTNKTYWQGTMNGSAFVCFTYEQGASLLSPPWKTLLVALTLVCGFPFLSGLANKSSYLILTVAPQFCEAPVRVFHFDCFCTAVD